MDFPGPEEVPQPWATWVPDRSPRFKLHDRLGTAKAAVGAQTGAEKRLTDGRYVYPLRGGVVYQMVDGKWVVQAVIEPGTTREDHLIFREPRKWAKCPGVTTVIQEHPYV